MMRTQLIGLSFFVSLAAVAAACGGDAPPPAAPPPSMPTPASTAMPTPPPVATPTAPAMTAPTAMPGPRVPGGEQHVTSVDVPKEIRAVVDAADRDPADRKLDAGRKPAEMLAFAGIQPGMKVADLAAAGGYTTELLARAVGTTGVVYGQNTAGMLAKFAEKPWSARLAKPVNKNIVKVTREQDDPLPPEAHDLDAVIVNLFYHDAIWLKVDVAKMNTAVFRALKPGGVYLVIDHSAKNGNGTNDAQTIHRIDETTVRQQVGAAGFTLAAEANFLRNPDDKRDWNTSPGAAADRRGTSDRFVLKFVKP